MKKLVRLSNTNVSLMNEILVDEYQYSSKKGKNIYISSEATKGGINYNSWLCVDGDIDLEFYGKIMYRLGIENNKLTNQ